MPKHAVLLVLERVAKRIETEPGRGRIYAKEVWAELYGQIELGRLYDAWRRELARREIPSVELRSDLEGFSASQPAGAE